MGRAEVLNGHERRRFWSTEQKRQILGEVGASGLGVTAIARRHDIQPGQIYFWRKILGKNDDLRPTAPSFLPVTIIAPEMADQAEPASERQERPHPALQLGRIEIGCKGGRILKVDTDFDSNFDAARLKTLIRLVEEA